MIHPQDFFKYTYNNEMNSLAFCRSWKYFTSRVWKMENKQSIQHETRYKKEPYRKPPEQ